MSFKNTVKKGFFSSLNPMRWIGYDQITGSAKTIQNLVNGIVKKSPTFSIENNQSAETFEECMRRFNLTESDIESRMKNTLRIVFFCLGLGLFLISYALYLFLQPLPVAAFVCIILTLVLGVYAFREHFNYFQMKQRRLGCTFKQWVDYTFKGLK